MSASGLDTNSSNEKEKTSQTKRAYKRIAECKEFNSLSREDKWNSIRKYKLCKPCLFKHMGECKKRVKCNVDGFEYYHHPSLHRFSSAEIQSKESSVDNDTSEISVKNVTHESVNAHKNQKCEAIFKIIPINVHANSTTIKTFAFIDEGSSISLMDESLLSEMNISSTSSPLCLKWTGGIERCENSSQK